MKAASLLTLLIAYTLTACQSSVFTSPGPRVTLLPTSTAVSSVTPRTTPTLPPPSSTAAPLARSATLPPPSATSSLPTTTVTRTPSRTPTGTATPEPLATLNAAGKVGLGVYVSGLTPYDDFASVQQFERSIKHKLQYVMWFQSWGDTDSAFVPDRVRSAYQKGLTPVITWEPWKRDFDNPTAPQPVYSLERIISGAHDDYIRSWARAARDTGIPIVIRFAHEQSTEPGTRPWYPWQGDPQAFKQAFRHIVDIFRAENARTVSFLWSGMWLEQFAPLYYPGDDIVDMIATTTLNHGTAADAAWAKWRSFDELFAAQYTAASRWGKPLMITEIATAEQGGSKPEWLREAFTSIREKYTLVQSVLLLESQKDREYPSINWSISSSPASLAAFLSVISNPYWK